MQYQVGTVNVTNGSATVNGTSTAWNGNLTAGDAFLIPGDNVTYTISTVVNDTTLTLSAPYGGTTATGSQYAAHRDFTPLGLPEFGPGDVGVAALLTRAMRVIDDKLTQVGAT